MPRTQTMKNFISLQRSRAQESQIFMSLGLRQCIYIAKTSVWCGWDSAAEATDPFSRKFRPLMGRNTGGGLCCWLSRLRAFPTRVLISENDNGPSCFTLRRCPSSRLLIIAAKNFPGRVQWATCFPLYSDLTPPDEAQARLWQLRSKQSSVNYTDTSDTIQLTSSQVI
jgi:hypothetical protein